MEKLIPEKLKKGDKVMIIAPARGLKIIGQDVRQIATER
jgi:muramoyltetrapeptide carboxypeptidase LdcA involved in peptidoglycan recycling